MKDLTVSNIERQNVLNNRFAIEHIQKTLDITGIMFDGEYRFTKKMLADFYEVEERTIERYIENYGSELSANGYFLCKGKQLHGLHVRVTHCGNLSQILCDGLCFHGLACTTAWG